MNEAGDDCLLRPVERLGRFTDEEAGQLLRALLLYGTTGEVPSFTDRGMKAIWRKVQGWADRDSQKYERTVLQRKYAAYCRKMRQEEQQPLGFADWEEQSTADNDSISPVDDRQPTETQTQTQTQTRTSSGTKTWGCGGERENQLTEEQRFEEKRREAIALLQREEGQQHAIL